jgi:hypothetical protein
MHREICTASKLKLTSSAEKGESKREEIKKRGRQEEGKHGGGRRRRRRRQWLNIVNMHLQIQDMRMHGRGAARG